ncbi:MAG: serine acetyltransferase [Anaerolineae bacterium]
MTVAELLTLIRWDLRANVGASFDRLRAMLLLIEIRVEQYVYHKVGHRSGLPRLLYWVVRFLGSTFQWFLCNSNVPGSVRIGRGLRLPHPQNIIIGYCAEIGEFCTIYHNVSIAWNGFEPVIPSRPKIGDQVLLGAGAIVLGDLSIGSYSLVGAGTVVTQSIPDFSRVTGGQPSVSPRFPSSDAAIPGSERHLRDPYSIWS